MNDSEVFKNPCAICRKREATQLCDFVVRYDNSIIFLRNWKEFQLENAGGHHETCDLPLCKKCSHQAGHHVDICPHHHGLLKQVELPKKYRKYQLKQKTKLYMGDGYEPTTTH
jgi:hypothetical protein